MDSLHITLEKQCIENDEFSLLRCLINAHGALVDKIHFRPLNQNTLNIINILRFQINMAMTKVRWAFTRALTQITTYKATNHLII